MATEYRRKIGTQIWHFHRDCFLWPQRFDFVVLYDRPHDERICQECIALRQHGEEIEKPPNIMSSGASIPDEETPGQISELVTDK